MVTMAVPKIKVALFDMAATTVDDMVEKAGLEGKLPLVISAYDNAFRKAAIKMPFDELNDCRGRDKIEVFKEKVAKYRTDLPSAKQKELAQQLHDQEFIPALLEDISYLKEMPGTTEAFQYLKEAGVYVATGSGFPQIVTDAINERLGWKEKGLVAFGTCGEGAGGGRPKPNMINQTLVAAGYLPQGIDLSSKEEGFDYSLVLKVGDTEADIKEGKSVGATIIAVSSGTQSIAKLVNAGPKVVLPSVAALPNYLMNHYQMS